MCEVTIRCEGGEFLSIVLIGRSHSEASDYWDGNWVTALVDLRAGGFRGSVGGHIRAEELAKFHDQLVRLQELLLGSAEFTTMEGWISIQLEGNGQGHIKCHCIIRDEPGIGNTLDCRLATDQTFTRQTLRELTEAVKTFPIIGTL